MSWERLQEGPEDPLTDDLDADILIADGRNSGPDWRNFCCGQALRGHCAASKQRYWIIGFVSALLLVSLIPVILVIHTHGTGGTQVKSPQLPPPTPTPFLEPFEFDNNSSEGFSPPEFSPMWDFLYDYLSLLRYSDKTNSTSPATGNSSSLEVTIFYEALDIPSREFLAHNFFPTYFESVNATRQKMSAKFVPFGHAEFVGDGSGTEKLKCEHFQDECQGNLVQACAIRHTIWNDTQSVDKLMNFIKCLMADTGKGGKILETAPDATGIKCSTVAGISWDPVYNCTRTAEGITILKMFQKKTTEVLKTNSTVFPFPVVQVAGYGILSETEKADFEHFIQSRLESTTGR